MGLSVSLQIDTGAGEFATVEVRDITYNNGALFRDALGIVTLSEFDGILAGEIADRLFEAAAKVRREHSRYRAMLADMMAKSGGWGGVEDSLDFLDRFAAACQMHPKMTVRVS